MIRTVKPGAAVQHDLNVVLQSARHHLSETSPILVLLQNLASALSRGAVVTVLEQGRELTPSEAASLVGISRSHLLAFMDAGALAYTGVGTRRRISLADLLDFDERRRSARVRLAEARRNASMTDQRPINAAPLSNAALAGLGSPRRPPREPE